MSNRLDVDRGRDVFDRLLTFEVNYTLSRDRSDDDNERDPFTFRYADPTNLGPEYGWSDRDRRRQAVGYLLFALPRDIRFSSVFRYLSASPVSESCASPGQRAARPSDRICADGSILQRNTLRRENDFLTWDIRLSRPFTLGRGVTFEPVFEIFTSPTPTTAWMSPRDPCSSTSTAPSATAAPTVGAAKSAFASTSKSRSLRRGTQRSECRGAMSWCGGG